MLPAIQKRYPPLRLRVECLRNWRVNKHRRLVLLRLPSCIDIASECSCGRAYNLSWYLGDDTTQIMQGHRHILLLKQLCRLRLMYLLLIYNITIFLLYIDCGRSFMHYKAKTGLGLLLLNRKSEILRVLILGDI